MRRCVVDDERVGDLCFQDEEFRTEVRTVLIDAMREVREISIELRNMLDWQTTKFPLEDVAKRAECHPWIAD